MFFVGLSFLGLTLVKGAEVYCSNCGSVFEVSSVQEAMNKRFCSDTCAEGFLHRIQAELNAGPASPAESSSEFNPVKNHPNFRQIITIIRNGSHSPEDLFAVAFNQYIIEKGLIVKKDNYRVIQQLSEDDKMSASSEYGRWVYEHSGAFMAMMEDSNSPRYKEGMQKWDEKEDCIRKLPGLLKVFTTREDLQAVWDGFLEAFNIQSACYGLCY